MLKKVDSRVNFPNEEKEILNWWKKEEIVKKYMNKNVGSEKRFSFVDGPITANNLMGLHHAWGRSYKDFVTRYKTMKGFEQRYQMGFDCQGLWVEVEVEKELGFNSKKDIFEFGLGNFTDACKGRVNKFSNLQIGQSERLGMFMDWENSYYTMSEENNLYIWYFLKECQKKGLIYKNHSATTWCPRCETGLSQHEQADGYKDVVDTSVFVKFKIKDRKNEYLLAWTTTPWTLSSNVLLAINPEFEYVKAKDGENVLYMAGMSAKEMGFENVEPVDVKELLGLEYESLYDIPAQKDIKHTVVSWNLVTEDSGTGIVHIAPGCGQEDFDLGKEVGAPSISPLDESGHFMDGFGDLTGKYAHDVKDDVLTYLKEKGLLFKTKDYEHSYPHCWRCKTKCLFRLENNWFINIDKIRKELKEQAGKVHWIPEFTGKRMEDWLKNMGDWMISRKRFYGLALPFYECECGELTVIGSKKELKDLASNPDLVDKLPSLHRPWIDDINIKCPKCGKEVSRISDVGDCWLDAGVVMFSTLKYNEDREYWKKWYPANFISEMIEQVRLWYYSTLVFGVVLDGTVPYEEVLSYAEMRDEKNEKMSKTKKNFIPFDEAADKMGSDIIRWTFALTSFGKNMRFGWGPMEETQRRFILPFWNSYTYFVMYALMHNWKWDKSFNSEKLDNILDKWIIAGLHKLINNANIYLDTYKFPSFVSEFEQYVMDLSTWYIRRSRDRFKEGDLNALNTLHYVLTTLAKLAAPIMPYMTEMIYQNLVVNVEVDEYKESVHLEKFPEDMRVDDKLLLDMQEAREICSIGLNIRDMQRIKIRQPLSKAYTNIKNDYLLDIIKDELNVKEVEISKEKNNADGVITLENNGYFVSLDTNLTDVLKEEGLYRELVRQIQDQRKKNGLSVGQKVKIIISGEDINSLIEKYEEKLLVDVSAISISVNENDGETVKIGDKEFKIKIEK